MPKCCLGWQDYNGSSGRSSPTGFQARAPAAASSAGATRLSTTANDGNEEVGAKSPYIPCGTSPAGALPGLSGQGIAVSGMQGNSIF